MEECTFCGIAEGRVPAVILYEDADVVAFLDITPIRPGHTQIIPREHYDYFDALPPDLGLRILTLGQLVAQRLKKVYGLRRVGFVFTGGDVPHVHAHVIPIHEGTDVTSARYIVDPAGVEWSSSHLAVDRAELLAVRETIGPVSTEDR